MKEKRLKNRVFCFVGASCSGKTTLLEKIIPLLVKRGFKVGAIKGCGVPSKIDYQDKDSYRLKEAGATQVVLSSAEQLAFISDLKAAPRLEQLIEHYLHNVDIILVEGYRSSSYPKILVIRHDNPQEAIPFDSLNNVLACISDGPCEKGIPHFKPDAYEAIADFIITKGKVLTFSDDVAGVILAGGRSSRLGWDKADIKISTASLLEKTAFLLEQLFEEIWVIGRKPDHDLIRRGIKWHLDLIQDVGPVAGIYTALKVIDKEACLVVACDMPRLNLSVLKKLLQDREGRRADIIISRHAASGKLEPLVGIYRKGILSLMEKLLAKRKFKVSELFLDSHIWYVDFNPREAQAFMNINTAQDLDRFRVNTR